MPLRKNPIFPGEIYHIYNRAVEKKKIFHDQYDYHRFLTRAHEYKELFPTEILAYCIMPNHFHFLIREPLEQTLNTRDQLINTTTKTLTEKFLHRLFSAYARYYTDSHKETHSGHVFQSRYKAKQVSPESSIEMLIAYIHDNPVRAGLVPHPSEWPYSSYLGLTGTKPDPLLTHDDKLSDLSHKKIWEQFSRDRHDHYPTITTFKTIL